MNLRNIIAVALLVALLTEPAAAQKSADTVRIAINDPFSVLSSYHVNVDEASNFYRGIYQPLMSYDERAKKWIPTLAKSWTRVSPTTLEFNLRDDVTFHNGNKFDADDVLGTYNWLIDPKSQVSFKQRYTWIQRVEKLGPYKVRIVAKEPLATDMQLLSFRMPLWDAETMGTLKDMQDYGRTPIGTGPMKLVFMDRNKGTMLEAVPNYWGDAKYFRSGAKRVLGVPLPDRQTQIAQILTGGIDMIRNASPDDARELDKEPNLDVSITPAVSFVYVALDAQGVSGNKLFTDDRVRRAIWMSIDRDAIINNIMPGGPKYALKLNGLCFATTTPSCGPMVLPPKYDPAAAKKLLAEAGYPNGIDYEYTVAAPQKPIAEAVAGSLLKAGIRATVRSVPISVYLKDRNEGKLQSWSIIFPTGTFPDAANTFETLMTGSVGQYYGDAELFKLIKDGSREFDDEKRSAFYQKAYDIVNSRHYILPIASVPNVYVHTKEIKIMDNPFMAGDTSVTDYAWK